MNRWIFYPKMAWINIKKNGKIYFPYILTCIGTILMFYNIYAIAENKGTTQLQGAEIIQPVMGLGGIIIGLFAIIFLFYTNSFLMKRRKKEIGLYNVLGMGKRHIAKMMFCETIMIALISLVLGIGFGIALNKLLFLALLKLMGESDIPFGFEISQTALRYTLILFGIIFFLILISNLWKIHLSHPIELLHGDQTGEREPKTKVIMTIIGIVSMGMGYYLALNVKSPMDAIGMFFVAVICVIIGTYTLFTAGSITFLKLLRRNKGYYYKTNHFVSVSSMIYRMKQNAVGLANICILSTMVLVVLSTTVSLYGGLKDALDAQFTRQVQMKVYMTDLGQKEMIQKNIQEAEKKTKDKITDLLSYYYFEEYMLNEDDSFQYQGLMTTNETYYIMLIPESQYEKMAGESLELKDNEIYYYTKNAKQLEDTVQIMDVPVSVKGTIKEISNSTSSIIVYDSYFMVATDHTVEQIRQKMIDASKQESHTRSLDYTYYIGADASKENAETVINSWENSLSGGNYELGRSEDMYNTEQGLKVMYGGFFFLGLFLGSLFLMATVLIIYYKQISEGYEDQKRFEIMQKVGMSRKEIKKAIGSQVLTVFFLPLVTACIHIVGAFKMISKLEMALGLANIQMFIWYTGFVVVVFAVIYAFVYVWTAREYYKIVQTS